LLLPWLAMQFTDEVAWDETDFIVFGAMLAGACGAWELAARMTGSTAYRAAVGVAVMSAFILVWMNLAVGMIGSEDNPANPMHAGPLQQHGESEPSRFANLEASVRSRHGRDRSAGGGRDLIWSLALLGGRKARVHGYESGPHLRLRLRRTASIAPVATAAW
jgi:hypothetical protein